MVDPDLLRSSLSKTMVVHAVGIAEDELFIVFIFAGHYSSPSSGFADIKSHGFLLCPVAVGFNGAVL
jgi:hypothetical protein